MAVTALKNMSDYLSWDEKTITDFSDSNINAMYEHGFVFTRLNRGHMTQTRSVRVDLDKFELSSENRRVLKKTENIRLENVPLPHPNYNWHIHKLGYDFYSNKFGPKTFSANKIKELITDKKSNFNSLLLYSLEEKPIGYCICFENSDWFHYGYPFYDLKTVINNLGIGMMTKAIIQAKENGKKFICLGSARNSAAIYKLQFSGVEWFDGKKWSADLEELKKIL